MSVIVLIIDEDSDQVYADLRVQYKHSVRRQSRTNRQLAEDIRTRIEYLFSLTDRPPQDKPNAPNS